MIFTFFFSTRNKETKLPSPNVVISLFSFTNFSYFLISLLLLHFTDSHSFLCLLSYVLE